MDNGTKSGGGSRKRKLMAMDDTRDDDYSGGIESEMGKFLTTSNKKHTIDSDEEEDELDADQINRQKHDVLDEDDIEGQEFEETLEFDGETKITPFNMKGELEEGYFDGSGMYIWNKKDADEIKDSWLDSVDWMKVKQPETNKPKPSDPDTDSDEEKSNVDASVYYKQLLKFLTPKETILKAIKRLGGGNKQLSASERLKQKKMAKKLAESGQKPADEPSGSSGQNSESQVNQLTELVNKIMYATGHMDIYDETFESITFKISKGKVAS